MPVESTFAPAGLGPRFLARAVDGVVVGLPAGYAYVSLGMSLGVAGMFLGAPLFGLAFFLYHVVMETRDGQTLGKKLVKVRVLAPNAQATGHGTLPPTFAEAARRNWFLLLLVPAATPVLLVTVIASFAFLGTVASIALSITSNPQRQGTHDGVAEGTTVVKA